MIKYNMKRGSMYRITMFFFTAAVLLGCRSVNNHSSQPSEGGISGFGTPPNWMIWESFKVSIQSYVLNDHIHFQIANHNDKTMLITQIVNTLYLTDGTEQKAGKATNVELKANSITHITVMKDLSKLSAQFTEKNMPVLTHQVYIDGFESPGLLVSPLLKNPPTPAHTVALYSPVNDSTSDILTTGFWLTNTPVSSNPLKREQETAIELHIFDGAGDIEFSSEFASTYPALGKVLVVSASSATLRIQKTPHGFMAHNSAKQYLTEEVTEEVGESRPIHTVKLVIKATQSQTSNGMAALTLEHSQNEIHTQLSFGIPVAGN